MNKENGQKTSKNKKSASSMTLPPLVGTVPAREGTSGGGAGARGEASSFSIHTESSTYSYAAAQGGGRTSSHVTNRAHLVRQCLTEGRGAHAHSRPHVHRTITQGTVSTSFLTDTLVEDGDRAEEDEDECTDDDVAYPPHEDHRRASEESQGGVSDVQRRDRRKEERVVFTRKTPWRHKATGRKGLDRFRRMVEFVLLTKSIFKIKRPQLSAQESVLFFLDIPLSIINQTDPESGQQSRDPNSGHRMLFDLTPFTAIREQSVSTAVRDVLNINPGTRTENQLTALVHVLQTFSKFAGYPQHVQRSICQRAWYARFAACSIIARQGQVAESYYLILSGLVIARSYDDKDEFGYSDRRQTAQFLRKGDTIGETELVHHIRRPATYITKEPIEVLGLDKEDYLNIFVMNGSSQCLEFIRSVDDLRDFPLDLLQTSQFSCCVHSYRRGAVIARNINESEWIFIVKSGSCQVYKSIHLHEKKKRIVRRSPSDLVLPNIHTKGVVKSRTGSSKKKLKFLSTLPTELVLPKINPGKNMVQADAGTAANENRRSRRSSVRTDESDDEQIAEKTRKGRPETSKTHDRLGSAQSYVKLDILTEKECFGLQTLIYNNTPNLSLVSNGAECIQISKQFFRGHLNTKLLHQLRRKVPAYPNLSHLQNALDDKVVWEAYKDSLVRQSLK